MIPVMLKNLTFTIFLQSLMSTFFFIDEMKEVVMKGSKPHHIYGRQVPTELIKDSAELLIKRVEDLEDFPKSISSGAMTNCRTEYKLYCQLPNFSGEPKTNDE